MERYKLALTEPQREWLEEEAGKLGIRWADLVRRIIDEKRLRKE